MKKLLFILLVTTPSYAFEYSYGTQPDAWVTDRLIELSDKAYQERTEKFIQSVQCNPVLNTNNEWGIICNTKEEPVYRKDRTNS